MSHWGGIGNLFGSGVLHIQSNEPVFKYSRRSSCARVQAVATERKIASYANEQTCEVQLGVESSRPSSVRSKMRPADHKVASFSNEQADAIKFGLYVSNSRGRMGMAPWFHTSFNEPCFPVTSGCDIEVTSSRSQTLTSTDHLSCPHGEMEEALFDPFPMSIGDAQMEFLRATKKKGQSTRNSCKETSKRGPKDFRQQDLDKDQLLTLIRDELRSRGAYEIAGIRTKFRRADKNRSGSLNCEEFKGLLCDQLDIQLSDADVKELFRAYDSDGYGEIDYQEFLLKLRGEISPERQAVLNWAFDTIDLDKSGCIDMNDLLENYNAEGHPDVVAKVCTAVDALKKFIRSFDVGGIPDGKVTRKEFADYYKSLSAGIESDKQFLEIMKSAWNLKGKPPSIASGSKSKDKGSAAAKDAPKATPKTKGSETAAKGKPSRDSTKKATKGPKDFRAQDLHVDQLVTLVRDELKSRGAYEVAGIRTKFRRADKNKNNSICFEEFKGLLCDQLFIYLSEPDMKELFRAYDSDGYGEIDYQEFLLHINGEISPARKAVLNWAFETIDLDKSGCIDMNDLLENYNAEGHPDVVAKVCTAVDALKRFIRNFDVGGVPDGKVTRKEFAQYYKSLSAGIDSDRQFIDIMKSAWNLQGDPPPVVVMSTSKNEGETTTATTTASTNGTTT